MHFTYLSLLAFNASPNLHIHTPSVFQVEQEKDVSKSTCFGVKVPRTLD